MRCWLRLDHNVTILDAKPGKNIARFIGPVCRLKGKRFDEFVDSESAETALHVLLDGYRGFTTKDVPVILSLGGESVCGFLSVWPISADNMPNRHLDCIFNSGG